MLQTYPNALLRLEDLISLRNLILDPRQPSLHLIHAPRLRASIFYALLEQLLYIRHNKLSAQRLNTPPLQPIFKLLHLRRPRILLNRVSCTITNRYLECLLMNISKFNGFDYLLHVIRNVGCCDGGVVRSLCSGATSCG